MCKKCDFEIEQTQVHFRTSCAMSLYYRDNVPLCPNCKGGVALEKETQIENCGTAFAIKGAPYSQPIHSDAMAIHPSQVAEHKAAFPDIKIDSQCRPVMENSEQHQKYMDACGFVKQRQSTKRKGEVIAVGGEDNDKD